MIYLRCHKFGEATRRVRPPKPTVCSRRLARVKHGKEMPKLTMACAYCASRATRTNRGSTEGSEIPRHSHEIPLKFSPWRQRPHRIAARTPRHHSLREVRLFFDDPTDLWKSHFAKEFMFNWRWDKTRVKVEDSPSSSQAGPNTSRNCTHNFTNCLGAPRLRHTTLHPYTAVVLTPWLLGNKP